MAETVDVDRILDQADQRRNEFRPHAHPLLHTPNLRELGRIPKEVMGFRIFGKSVGDLAKEAIGYGALGALFRIGLGTAGWQGFAVAAGAGAGVAAVKEIKRQYSENQAANLDRTALKQKLKSLGPHDKVRLGKAIIKGAAFGAAGGIVGVYLAETGFGEAVKGAFGKAGEAAGTVGRWRESWQIPQSEAPLRDKPFISPVAEAIGGVFHNVGLKIHEPTGWGLDSGQPSTLAEAQPTPADTAELAKQPPSATGVSRFGPVDVVGGAFHNLGLKAHELTGWGLDAGRNFVDHSKYFVGRMEITDSSPEWIKSINSLDGTYGKAIQGTVGEHWPQYSEEAFRITDSIGAQNPNLPNNPNAVANHILHIMEDKANQAFDSHLQTLVSQGVDLNNITDEKFEEMVKKVGRETFEQWLQTDATKDIIEGSQNLLQVQSQIESLVTSTPNLVAETKIISGGTNLFDAIFPNVDKNNTEQLIGILPDMGAQIAVDYRNLILSSSWTNIIGNNPFPAYPSEIPYLLQRAEGGDIGALMRLRSVLDIILSQDITLRKLSPEAVKKILELLKQIK